jgi:hypothetical protein
MGHYRRANSRTELLLQGFDELTVNLQPDSPPFWDLEGVRLEITEQLQTKLSYEYELRSDTISDQLEGMPYTALVPIAPISQRGRASPAHEAEISTPFGKRTIHPLEVKREQPTNGTGRRYLGLVMTAPEYASSPRVSLRARVPNTARFSARDIVTTVGFVEVDFQGFPPAEIAVQLPQDATADLVAVTVLVNLERLRKNLEEARDRITQAIALGNANTWLLQHLIFSYAGDIKSLLENLETKVESEGLRFPKANRASYSLRREVDAIASQSLLKGETGSSANPGEAHRQHLQRQLDRLILAISHRRCEYTYVLKLANGRLRLDDLVAIALSLQVPDEESPQNTWYVGGDIQLELTQLLVPFTMERDPQIHRLRTSVVLGLLALTLAIPALVLLPEFWAVPAPDAIRDIHASLIAPNPILPNSLRGPMATLLLLFPAALYSQFLQFRPGTPIAARARGGTYILLSLLFALPIVPAGLVAAGGSFSLVVVLMAFLAIVTLAAAAWTWFALRSSSMEKRRRKSVARAARP